MKNIRLIIVKFTRRSVCHSLFLKKKLLKQWSATCGPPSKIIWAETSERPGLKTVLYSNTSKEDPTMKNGCSRSLALRSNRTLDMFISSWARNFYFILNVFKLCVFVLNYV
ncbi:unnamed protein product [Clavelina lepadiformis]|uniref:Uncharacterized protein n=1 Tax=Clavelina lepadiformis TaxID=159417 RepID=A0ABP0GTF5_CLALP